MGGIIKWPKAGKCAICHRQIKGYNNNAYPVAIGRCCDKCNLKYVLPVRIVAYHDSWR